MARQKFLPASDAALAGDKDPRGFVDVCPFSLKAAFYAHRAEKVSSHILEISLDES
jgi:hypothetical protein